MSNRLRPVTKEVVKEFQPGHIGHRRKEMREATAKIKVRPKPRMPLNPSALDRIRYFYNNWMYIFETNDKRYKQGELSFIFSLKWLYIYVFFAIAINAMWFLNKYREKRRREQIIPELDQRRKEFDPFDEEGQKNISDMGTGRVEDLAMNRSAAALRVDSTFVDREVDEITPEEILAPTEEKQRSWLSRLLRSA